eukprot:m.442450 g.442450  ORF g.442450 m.442450 type:complete len:1163 (-) comp18809_c0_seq1:1689-5177(-)
MDFLDPKNQCGQTMLRLVSRGNAIIAELLRLSDYIPAIFTQNYEKNSKMGMLVLDFTYYKSAEWYDNRIDSSPELQDMDEELRENYTEILTRFYKAFESVYKYMLDVNRMLEDLEEGVFIQQTMDSVMQNEDGKQLMAESLFLYGVMLLVIDDRFESRTRERMLVSFGRYCGNESDQENITEVCKVLRGTGYSRKLGAKRPSKYPEEYFSRQTIPASFVNMLISRLSSDDIYNQSREYPDPQHRSAALATQATMLYVLLYFAPNVLYSETAKMREIVDKHFPDNWIISIYMGLTVDLVDAWEPYQAARTALANTIDHSNVQKHADRHLKKVPVLEKQILNLLKEGVLHREYVLDNVPKLVHTMREANVTIRWLMLHTHALQNPNNRKAKAVRDIVMSSGFNPKHVFSLLLNTAQYEFVMKEMFGSMLDEKQAQWDSLRHEGSDRMKELSDVFGGETPLSRVEKNTKLQSYFSELGNQIAQIEFSDSTSAGRKIVQLIQALEEVQEFHQLENSLQIRQFLQETRQSLHQMLRTINIKEEVLITFEIVADLSYAWEIIDNYTGFMQYGIKADPTSVIKLRATFLKLASALDIPLLRIGQAGSKDLASVSQHYSEGLVGYVRKVLQIIPETMFEILFKIIEIQTRSMKEVPTRLDKDKLKDFAQLDARAEVAKLTHSISIFTEGILMMKTTLMGVIKVDPKQLLEDGIRKELVRQVAGAFDRILVFNHKGRNPPTLQQLLVTLAGTMSGYKRSFEYIQDYVNIYGLKIWQEEVSRIVNYNVEQECNSFLRTVILDWQSVYQSKAIPIPRFPPRDSSVNFVGRLAREILRLTDPATTSYIENMNSWYDTKSEQEVLSGRICFQLQNGVGTFGLNGLDRFFSFMIVKHLQNFQKFFSREISGSKAMKELHRGLAMSLRPLTSTPDSLKPYQVGIQKTTKLWALCSDTVIRVGQIQLIRRLVANELNFSCQFDSKHLAAALGAFNGALLSDVEQHYLDPLKPYPSEESPLLSETSTYLECTGISNPLAKIYVTTTKQEYFPVAIFFYTISQIQRLQYSRAVGSFLARKPGDPVDGPPFVVGLITLLKQFHSTHTHRFFAYLGQYIRTHIELNPNPQSKVLPEEAISALLFIDLFCHFSSSSRKVATVFVPEYLMDQYRQQIQITDTYR